MSEPAQDTTLLRVIPGAFHLMIPLLFGPLMLLGGIEVTERGITIYANADGICVSYSMLGDLFIPWERLQIDAVSSSEAN
jgi:hypothetical protein